MKEAWPSFEEKVAFIPLDIGHGADLSELHSFAENQGYPWLIGRANLKMLSAYGVAIQSTKIAIDADGIIFYRAGYGEGTIEEWSSIMGSY
jgi:hypothetical protein